MAKRSALGKGLGAFFGEDVVESTHKHHRAQEHENAATANSHAEKDEKIKDNKTQSGIEAGAEDKTNAEHNVKISIVANAEANAGVNTEANTEVNAEANSEANAEANTEVNTEVNAETNAEVNAEVNADTNTEVNGKNNQQENSAENSKTGYFRIEDVNVGRQNTSHMTGTAEDSVKSEQSDDSLSNTASYNSEKAEVRNHNSFENEIEDESAKLAAANTAKGATEYVPEDLARNATQNVSENATENAAKDTAESTIVDNVSRETYVKLTDIEPNEEQPRKQFDEEELIELASSMKDYGVIQPLIVQKKGDFYQIVAGERRWRAAKLAGLKEVPVIVREYDRQQSMEIALIENVQRADLNPMEEAKAYQTLIREFGLKQDEIAERVAKSRTTVTNSLRLLKLAPKVQQMVIDEKLSNGHARALLPLEDHEVQVMTAEEIIEKGLSVREVEKLVKMLMKPQKEPKEKEEQERDYSFIFRDLEERMKGVMGTKVQIHQKDKNKGRIEIEYYSDSELERIVELIESIQ